MGPATKLTSDPLAIAEAGERIYGELYRAQFEAEHKGKFAAIDIQTGQAALSSTSVGALEEARKANPQGFFHLIRVGSPTAYKFSF